MLSHIIKQQINSLTTKISQPIVIRYQPKRSIFDKTSYNPEWVPRTKLYSKQRKPAMKIWSDPNKIVPFQIPPLRRQPNPKLYMKQVIEEEERNKALRRKQYIMDPIRSGDIVEITYQQTFESESTVTHRGFVLAFKRRNSLTAALEVLIRFGGMNIKAIYLIHSPKVKNIKLISKGSGNFRANLKHRWEKVGKNQVSKPRIRNRVMKLREGARRKVKIIRASAMSFDKIKSDNIKRII